MQAAQWCRISDVNSPLHPQSSSVSGEYSLFNFVREYEFYSFFSSHCERETISSFESTHPASQLPLLHQDLSMCEKMLFY